MTGLTLTDATVEHLPAELRKVAAFIRRDLLVIRSYRFAFLSDAVSLVTQTLVFLYVSRLVDPRAMPEFGGTRTSYLAFVTIGIAVTAFLQVGLGRMNAAIQSEQYLGTLESLLVSPTSLTTIQLGLVAYDLVYVPLRTVLFLGVAAWAFDIELTGAGFLPAVTAITLFIPAVWGLGVASAAAVLTFRRGAGLFGFVGFALIFTSGAYFPVGMLPTWLERIANANPVTLALDAARATLLGDAGWADIAPRLALLAGISLVALVGGAWAFRAALRRELRQGILGFY